MSSRKLYAIDADGTLLHAYVYPRSNGICLARPEALQHVSMDPVDCGVWCTEDRDLAHTVASNYGSGVYRNCYFWGTRVTEFSGAEL